MINEKMFGLGNEASIIRELSEYGNKRKEIVGEDNVYDFSIGNPSIPAPLEVNETLIDLLKNMDSVSLHGYTSAPGDKHVRDMIASNLNERFNCKAKGELIYLTQGASASLSISLRALINEGDEVIVFAPFFPEYRIFINNAGGKMVEVQPDLSSFYPDFEDFSRKISYRTKAVIINSPNNPTGVIYPHDVIDKIASILKSKQIEYGHEIYLCSDEPYRELVYKEIEYPFITNYYDNSLVFYSFSKSISLPGERIGYILVSSKCKDSERVYKAICGAGRSLGFICASSLFQFALPKIVNSLSDLSKYKENRDILSKGLLDLGYEFIQSEGAFYLFVKALEDDAVAFCKKALKYDLILVPSDSFGIKGYVRIAYCVNKKRIIDSLPAFRKLKELYLEERK